MATGKGRAVRYNTRMRNIDPIASEPRLRNSCCFEQSRSGACSISRDETSPEQRTPSHYGSQRSVLALGASAPQLFGTIRTGTPLSGIYAGEMQHVQATA
jgi:hypothetical protein